MICLFCKNERSATEEHPFSEAVGKSTFVVRSICKDCNDVLGHDVDALGDKDAKLSHARRSAGLPIRAQSIKEIEEATGASGTRLKTRFDPREGAAVIVPQRDGAEIVVGFEETERSLREQLRAQFRRAREPITNEEVNGWAKSIMPDYVKANVGETVTSTYRGLTLTLTKESAINDVATVTRWDEPGAIKRVSAKIAFEIAAHALDSSQPLLAGNFDQLREWVRTGVPEPGADVIEILREPAMEGGDAEQQHTVTLVERDGLLFAEIAYYGAYEVRVKLGPAVGVPQPWSRRFELA